MSFWQWLRDFATEKPESYDLGHLVAFRLLEEVSPSCRQHIVCDIDKTYLETEFESWIKMARIPFEAARDKVTVQGASEVLRAARWSQADAALQEKNTLQTPVSLHFVSSSPPQLRTVLEDKLLLDGLDWNSDTFKDQSYNIRMRRMDLLRHHIAYKICAIIRLFKMMPAGSSVVLVGDNAESDGMIYCSLKALLEGRIAAGDLRQLLQVVGVENMILDRVIAEAQGVPSLKIQRILIREIPGYATVKVAPFDQWMVFFQDFFQVGCLLVHDGFIMAEKLWMLLRAFHNAHGVSLEQLSSTLKELVEIPALDKSLLGSAAKQCLKRLQPHLPVAAASPDQEKVAPSLWLEALQGESGPTVPADTEQLIQAMQNWHRRLEVEKLKRRTRGSN